MEHNGPARLSRTAIVKAALALVKEGGLDKLSMRRLGASLQVDPMAIYYHIPNKRALIDALVEHVFAGFAPPRAAGAWQEQVRSWAHAYRRLALQHPQLVLEIVTDQAAVATAARHADPSLHAAMETAGLHQPYVQAATHTVVDYVNGFVLGEASMPRGAAAEFELGLDILIAGLEGVRARPPAGQDT